MNDTDSKKLEEIDQRWRGPLTVEQAPNTATLDIVWLKAKAKEQDRKIAELRARLPGTDAPWTLKELDDAKERIAEQDREIDELQMDLCNYKAWRESAVQYANKAEAELSACKERVRELEEAAGRIKLQPQECQRIMAKHGWKYDDSEDFNQKMIFTMYSHVVQCAVEAEQALEAQGQSKEVGG